MSFLLPWQEKESERIANRVHSNLQRLKGTHRQRTNSLSYKPSDCSANLTGATQFQSILPNQITMTTNTSNNILRSILDKEKLSGTNFLDWQQNLRIVLKHDKKLYVLEKPVPEEEPPSSAPKAERDAYKKHVDDANETACLMLATMNS
ncbi:hypothetical protein KIW84_053681 [Lathyrus oleraceus]|uniref:Uncharacterized protein n=1 Tax=Pisum sativum TaxID=3888 RepID=A0A9D4WVL4_PEA|nr:hypothetical protein KIW84_053681 [Pisum sativum]